jgi:predicted ArsR family transcriptional regulator
MQFWDTDERLLQSTKGKVLSLLRRRERTVQELAEELGLTDNAVRSHLANLERDGFVRSVSTRRSARKPARVYTLVPNVERRFSQAYPPFLSDLFDALEAELPAEQRVQLMREVGTRLAGERRIPPGPGLVRARAAADVVEELGGSCEVVPGRDGLAIRGNGCPLSVVSRTHEGACMALETMLSTMLGCKVRERCSRGEQANCRFETTLQET